MSGTSLDGLDVALCRITNSGPETEVKILKFETEPFNDSLKAEVRKIFAKEQINFQDLCLLNPWIALQHGHLINECLKKWQITPDSIDLIASHGQTVLHAPKRLHQQSNFGNSTLQIGDGDHLAVKTGIITVSDFRQKHIASGGEGAPLAVYGDYLIFSKRGEERIMLNIGGIANFTYLSADLDPDKVFSTDVGPGNTLIDVFVRKFYPQYTYDKDGEIARSGKVNIELLKELKSHSFFVEDFPKSTGPELFSVAYVEKALQESKNQHINPEDLLSTLTQLSADSIITSIKSCFEEEKPLHVYSSGGGIHNKELMRRIQVELPNCIFHSTEELGITPDAKEAVLFAVLANELVAGKEDSLFGNPAREIPKVTMGKISFPDK
ncbi:Anhydro-N-acetylmuramic acid kinase [compost metagenome]